MLKQIYWFEVLKDDKVIENYFDVPYLYTSTGFGLPVQKEGGEDGGAYIIKPSLVEYEQDFPKLHYPEFIIDFEGSVRLYELAEEVVGRYLKVRRYTSWWWTLGMTWSYIDLRGLEEFLCDMILEPEWVHKTMNLLCEGILGMLGTLEKRGLLSQNTGGSYVGSGGFGYTSSLPEQRGRVKTKDMWGFVESQETSSVSPEMYGEFVFPYHKRIAQKFGLNCYGCCEAFENRWKYVSQLPNLRRVSCSPWSNREVLPELLGKNYISSVKLSPTPLAFSQMDENVVRKDIQNTLAAAQNCVVELIMKDNHTLGKNPGNAARWVEIARQEIALL